MIKIETRDGLHRLVDDRTGEIALRSDTGAAIDGGGHLDKEKAERQAGYINRAIERKKEV